MLYRPCNARGKNLKIDWLLSVEEKRSVIIGVIVSPERILPFLSVSLSKEIWAWAEPNKISDDMRDNRKDR